MSSFHYIQPNTQLGLVCFVDSHIIRQIRNWRFYSIAGLVAKIQSRSFWIHVLWLSPFPGKSGGVQNVWLIMMLISDSFIFQLLFWINISGLFHWTKGDTVHEAIVWRPKNRGCIGTHICHTAMWSSSILSFDEIDAALDPQYRTAVGSILSSIWKFAYMHWTGLK